MHGWANSKNQYGAACCMQVLALVCCLLTFLPGTLPNLGLSFGQGRVLVVDLPDGEERSPIEDEDESSEPAPGEPDQSESKETLTRQPRNPRRRVSSVAWMAHLPHHHDSMSGYVLPVCSPYASGVSLPLRC